MITRSTKRILFEAHGILKWTQKERGYRKVKSLMIACKDRSVTGYMNQIHLGEVYYKTIRVVGIDAAQSFLQNFLRLPINIILPDSENASASAFPVVRLRRTGLASELQ